MPRNRNILRHGTGTADKGAKRGPSLPRHQYDENVAKRPTRNDTQPRPSNEREPDTKSSLSVWPPGL